MYAKAQVIGNLGRDPETRYTKNGTMNVSFSIASTRRFNDQSGQQQERTTWFRVTAWGKLAETMDRLAQDGALAKGQRVFVNGRLEQSEYTGQDGQQRTSLDITADDIMLMSARGQGGGTGEFAGSRESSGPANVAEDIDELPF
jgi:single-strand DNA-binding protein